MEIHGRPMCQGDGIWRSVKRQQREPMMHQILTILNRASVSVRAFGIVVNKEAVAPRDPVEYACEEICNHFDLYLQRRYKRNGGREEDKQRGLIVMDKSHYQQPLQALANSFRLNGARWGQLRNIAEAPFC